MTEYYTIQNNQILIAENKSALTRFYDNVSPLPDDYEVGKYIIRDIETKIEVPDCDEEGNPIMTEYEDAETIIDYDEEGNPVGSHEITVIKCKQSTNTETVIVKGLILNPNWEEEKARQERERHDALFLTPSDIERALYKAKGMDFEDLKILIAQQAPQIDMKGLAIEFRANNFYRGVEVDGIKLIDTVGALLGYTPADMDYLFEHKELPTK